MTLTMEHLAKLPPDAIVRVVNAWRDAYEATLGDGRPWHDAHVAAAQAFRDALASVLPRLGEAPPTAGWNAPNNVVACVSCKQPVQVTAINAIRCEKCVEAPPMAALWVAPAWLASLLASYDGVNAPDSTIVIEHDDGLGHHVLVTVGNLRAALARIPAPGERRCTCGAETEVDSWPLPIWELEEPTT